MNAIESITRSPEAESIYCQARRAVDEVERRHYDGRMPLDRARQVYLQHTAALCVRAMREELEPLDSAVSRLVSLIASPCKPLPIPPEIQAHREAIMSKWHAVMDELRDRP